MEEKDEKQMDKIHVLQTTNNENHQRIETHKHRHSVQEHKYITTTHKIQNTISKKQNTTKADFITYMQQLPHIKNWTNKP